jgi:hypothetical protein
VIDVRVRQQHPINRGRVDGQLVPIALLQLFRTFEKAAIDQQLLAFRFDQIFRAGDGAGSAEKSNFGNGAVL